MILQDFSHGNGVQSKKIWHIWDETNQEIRQVFQDVVICDLDFSASQFALVRVVHSQTWGVTAQAPNIWLTPELAGYIQEQRVPACWVAKNMHGMSRSRSNFIQSYSRSFFFGLLGTHSFWSCLVHIKSSHKLKLLDDWWLMLRTSLAPHSSLLIESHLDYLFRAKHPQVQNKYPSCKIARMIPY